MIQPLWSLLVLEQEGFRILSCDCILGKYLVYYFIHFFFPPWCYHIVCPGFTGFRLEIQARLKFGGLGAWLNSFLLTGTHPLFKCF